jgi:pilus assembly protein CpaB
MAAAIPQKGAANQPKQVVDPRAVRRKGWMLSIAAALLATLAGMAFFMYLNRLEMEIGLKQTIVVASKPIPARALITPDMLTTAEMPVKYLSPNFLLSTNDLLDGNTTALINISPGEYIQQNMISRNSGLEAEKRAVSIAVDTVTSVGNSVRQGNYVDIIVSFENEAGRNSTEVLLQNVKVLAVDTLLPAQGGPGGQTYLPAGVEGEVKLAPTTVVTLELSPEDALRVTHAANFAQELRLMIRRLDEDGTPNIAPQQFIGKDPALDEEDTIAAPSQQDE